MAEEIARIIFMQGQPKQIGNIIVDVFSRETHNRSSEVTKYPIENGGEITDFIINNPFRLEIEGMIAQASLTDVSGSFSRVIDGYEKLSSLMEDRELITVVTGLKVYSNMAITNFVVRRNARDGGSLMFNMNFEQVIVIDSQAIFIPNIQLGGDTNTQLQTQGEQDMGKVDSGQTQQNEEDDFLMQIQADIDEIFSAFGE